MNIKNSLVIIVLSLWHCNQPLHRKYIAVAASRNARKKGKAQDHKGFDPSRIICGGGFGFGFGSVTNIEQLSPIVGYRFTDQFSAGIGLGYQYFSIKDAFS